MILDFNAKVYAIVKLIPKGKVTTYGHIAQALGSKRSSRMVGWAMNKCHSMEENIPAHRVVNRNGMLTGKHHFATVNLMQELLENEGIKIKKDIIQDFEDYLWKP